MCVNVFLVSLRMFCAVLQRIIYKSHLHNSYTYLTLAVCHAEHFIGSWIFPQLGFSRHVYIFVSHHTVRILYGDDGTMVEKLYRTSSMAKPTSNE